LVDSTQGIQAQTLATLEMAKTAGCVVMPVISKIDAPTSRPDDVALELAALLDCAPEDVFRVSGKTGEGVATLLNGIIEKIPAPSTEYEGTHDFPQPVAAAIARKIAPKFGVSEKVIRSGLKRTGLWAPKYGGDDSQP